MYPSKVDHTRHGGYDTNMAADASQVTDPGERKQQTTGGARQSGKTGTQKPRKTISVCAVLLCGESEVMVVARLTAKQQRFVEEYMIDLNATQAAIRAGYSAKSAKTLGPKTLENVGVRARIDELRAEQSRRTGISADRVVRELARVGFLDPAQVVDLNTARLREGATADDRAAIAGVRVKIIPGEYGDGEEREIKFADKLKALEQLGRHLGIFEDKLKLEGNLDFNVVVDYGDASPPTDAPKEKIGFE